MLKSSELLDERDEKGQQYSMLHHGKSLMEDNWDRLDEAFDAFMTETDPVQKSFHKGEFTAYAKVLHAGTKHWWPEIAGVHAMAVTRRKIRLKEIDWEPTPGCNYNPPPLGSKAYEAAQKAMMGAGPAKSSSTTRTARSADNSTRPSAASSKGKIFSEAEAQGVRNARDSGLLTAAQLAETFKVTVAEIEAL